MTKLSFYSIGERSRLKSKAVGKCIFFYKTTLLIRPVKGYPTSQST